jgi:hypothetical protein
VPFLILLGSPLAEVRVECSELAREARHCWNRYCRRLFIMSTYPPPGPGAGGIGRRIEEAIELIEMELRHAAAYVNDAVIPQVRSESISALRNVANGLRNFADRLDRQAGQPPQPPPQPPQEPRP